MSWNPAHEARQWLALAEQGEAPALTTEQAADYLRALARVIEAQRYAIDAQQAVIGVAIARQAEHDSAFYGNPLVRSVISSRFGQC